MTMTTKHVDAMSNDEVLAAYAAQRIGQRMAALGKDYVPTAQEAELTRRFLAIGEAAKVSQADAKTPAGEASAKDRLAKFWGWVCEKAARVWAQLKQIWAWILIGFTAPFTAIGRWFKGNKTAQDAVQKGRALADKVQAIRQDKAAAAA